MAKGGLEMLTVLQQETFSTLILGTVEKRSSPWQQRARGRKKSPHK